mgnify:CR=1 FL=1
MSKMIIEKRNEESVFITINGKVIYIDDTVADELFIDAWYEDDRDRPVAIEGERDAVNTALKTVKHFVEFLQDE